MGKYGGTNFEQNMLLHFGEKIFHKDYFDRDSVLKKSYQYIYAARGSFAMISRWITDEHEIDLDTMTEWITEVNVPLISM